MVEKKEKMLNALKALYGDRADVVFAEIEKTIDRYKAKINRQDKEWLDEKDCMLITYADSIYDDHGSCIRALGEFLNTHMQDSISAVHILPFYPYSSDDGFSVIDYHRVREELGGWDDIGDLSSHYDLMFDAVINHVSSESGWFQNYLKGNEEYKNFFIECDGEVDLRSVTRPRALPLLTEFCTDHDDKRVWTTFSPDQIDLNYKEPKVLLAILDVLLMYICRGARYIRLDAIGFLWKEIGTSCMNLPQTHLVIRLIRMVVEAVDESVVIVTETNVPHRENASYFGNGYNEAHVVYQFPLPPLTLHAFLSQNSYVLLKWLEQIDTVSDSATYLNFLASHDGIGLRPLEGILDEAAIDTLVEATLANGGKVSYRNMEDGSKKPYELNISYIDAICDKDMDDDMRVAKFMASQAVLLSVMGIPGIYIHSLIGSRNNLEEAEKTGINRRINRGKVKKDELFRELDDQDSLRAKVLGRYLDLLHVRKMHPAFSPDAGQEVMYLDRRLFSIQRTNGQFSETVNVLINLSEERVTVPGGGFDLITQRNLPYAYEMKPYEVVWQKVYKGYPVL